MVQRIMTMFPVMMAEVTAMCAMGIMMKWPGMYRMEIMKTFLPTLVLVTKSRVLSRNKTSTMVLVMALKDLLREKTTTVQGSPWRTLIACLLLRTNIQ
jgi:hypothetical protein